MSQTELPTVTVTPNGPYVVANAPPLSLERLDANAQGEIWEFENVRAFPAQAKMALCRCGKSADKPFCDGTHKQIGFDGTETATHDPFDQQAETFDGPKLVLEDAQALCAYARFCDGGGSIWKNVEHTDDPKLEHLTRHQGTHCPSGRLVLHEAGGHEHIEPAFDPALVLLEDPAENCSGPLALRGRIRLVGGNGEAYEQRNRVALCRCGASANKPFCDGSHAQIGFQDGLGA